MKNAPRMVLRCSLLWECRQARSCLLRRREALDDVVRTAQQMLDLLSRLRIEAR